MAQQNAIAASAPDTLWRIAIGSTIAVGLPLLIAATQVAADRHPAQPPSQGHSI